MQTLKTIFKIFLISTFLFSCGGGGGGGFARPEGMPDPNVVSDETPAALLFGDWTCTSKVRNIDCESEQELEGLDINENQEEQDEFRITQTENGCKFEELSGDEDFFPTSSDGLVCRSGGNQVSIEWHDQQSNNGCTGVADLTGLLELNEDQSKLEGEVGVFTDVSDSCPDEVKNEAPECMIVVDVSCEPSSASQTFEVPDLPASPDLFGIWDCEVFFESPYDNNYDASDPIHSYYQFTSGVEGCEVSVLNFNSFNNLFTDNIECRAGGDVLVLTKENHYESDVCVADAEYSVRFEVGLLELRGQPILNISESGNCSNQRPVSDWEWRFENYYLHCFKVEMGEIDRDNDGVFGQEDNCPNTANPNQENTDGLWGGDACNNDLDNDEIEDDGDNCPLEHNRNQEDNDGDGIGDECDDDEDNDGVLDEDDNCYETPNPDQTNTDSFGGGDACNEDDDGDGVPDEEDNCPRDRNWSQEDSDGDGVGDECDNAGPAEMQCFGDADCPSLLGLRRRCISHSCIVVALVQQCNLISDCLPGYLCLNGHCMPPLGR